MLNTIILCAGKGSRMKSDYTHKVCFEIAGKPAIERLITELRGAGLQHLHLVVGSMAEQVMSCVTAFDHGVSYIYQQEPKGTGHAAQVAMQALNGSGLNGSLLIVMGDKLIDRSVIQRAADHFEQSQADALLVVQPSEHNRTGGHIVIGNENQIMGIIENSDVKLARLCKLVLTSLDTIERNILPEDEQSLVQLILPYTAQISAQMPEQEKLADSLIESWRKSGLSVRDYLMQNAHIELGNELLDPDKVEQSSYVNTATYLFRMDVLNEALQHLTSENAQQELYLTDVISWIAGRPPKENQNSHIVYDVIDNPDLIMTFNTVDELMRIERKLRDRNSQDSQDGDARFQSLDYWIRSFTDMTDSVRNQFVRIYGEDSHDYRQQRDFYLQALRRFGERYGWKMPVMLCRAPGRINLMGRHIEHRGGSINVISINQEVIAVVAARDDDLVNITNVEPHFPEHSFNITEHLATIHWNDWVEFIESEEIRKLVYESRGDWGNYVRAAVYKLQFTYQSKPLKGMDMVFYGNIPMAAGLSSSSAVVVATAEAAIAVNNLDVSVQRLVDLCGSGEWFVGSRGGAGDHAAMKFGNRGNIAHLSFFPFRFVETIPFPADHTLVIANSFIKAQKTTNAKDLFNQRIASYEFGLMMLRHNNPALADRMNHLRDINPETLGIKMSSIYEMLLQIPEHVSVEDVFQLVPSDEHERVRQIMRSHAQPDIYLIRSVILYGIAECRRAEVCVSLLKDSDYERFGQLMAVSHDGDRIVRWKDDQSQEYDYSASDMYIRGLINDLQSEVPERVSNAQLEWQPGGYACSTPDIDFLVDTATEVPGVIGAQLSGAGLGGCIMILVQNHACTSLIKHLDEKYYNPRNLSSGTLLVNPVQGSMIWDLESANAQ